MSVLDKDILQRFYEEVCDREIEILVDIATDCVNETQALARDVHTSLSEQNWELFNRAAHSMKSTSKALGGLNLSSLAEKLENLSVDYKQGDFDPSPLGSIVADLDEHVKSFVQELRNEVAKEGGTI